MNKMEEVEEVEEVEEDEVFTRLLSRDCSVCEINEHKIPIIDKDKQTMPKMYRIKSSGYFESVSW